MVMQQTLVENFERDGFVGPFAPFLSSREIDEYRNYFEDIISNRREHPLYGRFSVRDWHLVSPQVLNLLNHPAIIEKLIPLAGRDLVLWRSKVFYKKPRERELGWHQEWGKFAGDEIGNNKPSLLPATSEDKWWNLTIWIALDDITIDNGPVQFVRGSHKTKYPVAMVPLIDSAFFHDPFIGITESAVVIDLAKQSKLVLDIDTSTMFEGVDVSKYTLEQLKTYVWQWLADKKGEVTLPFQAAPDDIATMTVRKGQFIIFTERTMHGSLPNNTDRSRIAINCRVTTTDTLIYPARLQGDYIDSSNLDISQHRCVLLSGKDQNGQNVYK